MKNKNRFLAFALLAGMFTTAAVAETSGSTRYDNTIQQTVAQKLQDKKDFHNLQASVEDGIVTLNGSVNLYAQKLDAAKKVRKLDHVQGVRNLIEVSSTAPDAQIAVQLQRKLDYDRVGYDAPFNYVAVSVQDGVATLNGTTRTAVAAGSAMYLAGNMPGVKDVVNDITVAPVSNYDDDIRIRAARAIYRDSVLSRYAIDPAAPIRIVVDRGQLSLFGVVSSKMDKEIAGMRAGQVFGVFSVQNNLVVANQS